MQNEHCFSSLCFVPFQGSPDNDIFGFGAFITAVALFLVLYSTADVRYKFRLAVTPGSLFIRSFYVIAIIGLLILLTDIWEANSWPVPRTAGLNEPLWEAALGSLFFATFLVWIWRAYVSPPVFSHKNARSYATELYTYIVRGNDNELPIIAQELARSSKPIISNCTKLSFRKIQRDISPAARSQPRKDVAGQIACDILYLIAHRKFCRHIVAYSPTTVYFFFTEASRQRKYAIPLGSFGSNITTAAIENKDSILYHETQGFDSGLIGHQKPWTRAVYGDYELIHALELIGPSPLDITWDTSIRWDAAQWTAYARAITACMEGYLRSRYKEMHSTTLYRALGYYERCVSDLYTLNDFEGSLLESDVFNRLEAAVRLATDLIDLLDKEGPPRVHTLRKPDKDAPKDPYDLVVKLCYNIVYHASTVYSPQDLSWAVQQNVTWSRFFTFGHKTPAWRVVQFRLRRNIYNKIMDMDRVSPNFVSARLLGMVLNLYGLKNPGDTRVKRDSESALGRALLPWVRRNYLRLYSEYPEVAKAVLSGGISFDTAGKRLVKTYTSFLGKEPDRDYLDLDPVS